MKITFLDAWFSARFGHEWPEAVKEWAARGEANDQYVRWAFRLVQAALVAGDEVMVRLIEMINSDP
jgi:hypothetical protein